MHLWAQAAHLADPDDVAAIRRALPNQSFEAPGGRGLVAITHLFGALEKWVFGRFPYHAWGGMCWVRNSSQMNPHEGESAAES